MNEHLIQLSVGYTVLLRFGYKLLKEIVETNTAVLLQVTLTGHVLGETKLVPLNAINKVLNMFDPHIITFVLSLADGVKAQVTAAIGNLKVVVPIAVQIQMTNQDLTWIHFVLGKEV